MTRPRFHFFWVTVAAGVFLACGGADFDDPEATSFDEAGESVASAEQELTALERCPDLVAHLSMPKFCGPLDGPFDRSPVIVQCTSTCVTDRFLRLTSTGPGAAECGTGETECTPWECPSCD